MRWGMCQTRFFWESNVVGDGAGAGGTRLFVQQQRACVALRDTKRELDTDAFVANCEG
jgi:hypothetical protein